MAKPENQIDYIELPATQIDATKQFYSAVFGWKCASWLSSVR